MLGLSEDKKIAPADEMRGKLLLAEILYGGNFGRHFTKWLSSLFCFIRYRENANKEIRK